MLNRDSAVQGVATYLEFEGDYGYLQYVVTPHGFSEDGAMLKPYAIHRMCTTRADRSRWKRVIVGLEPNPDRPEEETTVEALSRTDLRSLTQRLMYGSWNLVGAPLFVEVSKKDLSDLRKGKTPTALMTRVDKAVAVAEYHKDVEEEVQWR